MPAGAREGQRAPDFTAQRAGGGELELEALRGRPVVLVFWASWCGPCLHEVPALNRLAVELGEEVHLVGVNAGEPRATVDGAVRSLDIRYPVALDESGRISAAYEVASIPLVLVLDGQGRVRYRGNGLPGRIHALVAGLQE